MTVELRLCLRQAGLRLALAPPQVRGDTVIWRLPFPAEVDQVEVVTPDGETKIFALSGGVVKIKPGETLSFKLKDIAGGVRRGK